MDLDDERFMKDDQFNIDILLPVIVLDYASLKYERSF